MGSDSVRLWWIRAPWARCALRHMELAGRLLACLVGMDNGTASAGKLLTQSRCQTADLRGPQIMRTHPT
eukprot:364520-Chlamydomonas_euryale.AAC.1